MPPLLIIPSLCRFILLFYLTLHNYLRYSYLSDENLSLSSQKCPSLENPYLMIQDTNFHDS